MNQKEESPCLCCGGKGHLVAEGLNLICAFCEGTGTRDIRREIDFWDYVDGVQGNGGEE